MESTYIRDTANSRIRSATTFGGINRANGTPLGEWDRLNGFDLTAYPALRTCLPYAYSDIVSSDEITGYTYRNGILVYTTAEGIYLDGAGTLTAIPGLSAGDKVLVNIGAYIVILPDWKRVNIASSPIEVDSGGVENDIVGTVTEKNSNTTKPTVAIYKRWYIVTPYGDDMTQSKKISRLHRGDSMHLIWTDTDGNRQTRDIRVKGTCIFNNSGKLYFRVEFDVSKLSTSYFYMADEQSDGCTSEKVYQNVTLTRSAIPDMDYVIEYNNRLWGCSSKNHEIYCSKLGDPFQWGEYNGISTDSWAATVGTDGDFTGACVFNGCVLFFKEDCVHSVYGTKASNFTITTYTVRGVQKGSANSLCISEGLLYYKAPEGIFMFNGSASSRFDGKLCVDRDSRTACGAADDRYIVMAMSDGTVFYYDKLHSVWYTRTLPNVISMHNFSGSLYAITKDSNKAMQKVMLTTDVGMSGRMAETAFEAITGELCRGELTSTSSYSRKAMHTVIKKLTMSVEEWHQQGVSSVQFTVSVQYDGGDWQTVYSYDGTAEEANNNVVTLIPTIPMRCQRLRIKISGKLTTGLDATAQPYLTLYGLFIDTEEASDIGGKH